MRKIFFAIITLSVLAGCSRFSNRGTVENPVIGSSNTQILSFEKIELTDSSTLLHAVAHFRPNWWINLTSCSVIIADGDTFALESAEGITPDERFWMPDSGVAHFKLRFPAIPSSAKKIDFSENTADGFMLWDIDLTGKADPTAGYGGIPAELLAKVSETEIPAPVLAVDSATVKIHLSGYKTSMGNKLGFYLNTMSGQVNDLPALDIDADGNATFHGILAGPTIIHTKNIGDIPVRGYAVVAPGESIDLYTDLGFSGIANMIERGDSISPGAIFCSTGTYGPIVRSIRENPEKNFSHELYTGKYGNYHMDGDSYTDYIIGQHRALKDSLAAAGLSPLAEKMWKINLDASLMIAAQQARDILKRNYYSTYGNWGEPIPADSLNITLSDDNLRRIASEVDLNNPAYMYHFPFYTPFDLAINGKIWNEAGLDGHLTAELADYSEAYNAASKGKLTDKQLAQLRGLSIPFYAEAVESRRKEIEEFMSKADMGLVTATPDVADDKLIDAIVAPYKGKVVMVDLWNTWCGPCRASIAVNEPEKSGDLSSEDIVWIYIADESSPIKTYLSMIPDIKGIHYRVSPEQISAIRSHFGVDGIPYYILVDRKGKATGRPDLRDHDLFKKTLIEEVNKK